MNIFLIAFAALLGGLRGFGVVSASFQAVAHIFVAYTFTAAYYDRPKRFLLLALGFGLTLLEVWAFFALK